MSDEKKKEAKNLTKEILEQQVAESQKAIENTKQTILRLTDQLHQQVGVLNYAQHILATFDIPAEPKEDKKPPIEVK